MEGLTRSVSQLSQTVKDTYNFAYSSPAKLYEWTSYFQTKSTQSTLFVGELCLSLLDLLKNQHMKLLIESVLGILEALVLLLQTEDCKLLLKSLINIAASQPIQLLIQCFAKIIKSMFYLMRTPEIEKFKQMARNVITQLRRSLQLKENEMKKSNNRRSKLHRSKTTRTGKPPRAPASARKDSTKNNSKSRMARRNREGPGSSTNTRDDSSVDYGSDNIYQGRSFSQSAPFTPPKARMPGDGLFDEAMDESKHEPQSWFSVSGIVQNILHTPPRGAGRDLSDAFERGAAVTDDDSSSTESDDCAVRPRPYRVFNRNSDGNNNNNSHAETQGRNNNNNNNNSSGNQLMGAANGGTKKANKVHLGDWVALTRMIESLEEARNIAPQTGKKLRKLAREQNMELMIVFKCYHSNSLRFIDRCNEVLESNDEVLKYSRIESNVSRKLEATLHQLLMHEMEQNKQEGMKEQDLVETLGQTTRGRSGSLTGLATRITSHATSYVRNVVGVGNNNGYGDGTKKVSSDSDANDEESLYCVD